MRSVILTATLVAVSLTLPGWAGARAAQRKLGRPARRWTCTSAGRSGGPTHEVDVLRVVPWGRLVGGRDGLGRARARADPERSRRHRAKHRALAERTRRTQRGTPRPRSHQTSSRRCSISATCWLRHSNSRPAIAVTERAVALSEAETGSDSLDVARALDSLGKRPGRRAAHDDARARRWSGACGCTKKTLADDGCGHRADARGSRAGAAAQGGLRPGWRCPASSRGHPGSNAIIEHPAYATNARISSHSSSGSRAGRSTRKRRPTGRLSSRAHTASRSPHAGAISQVPGGDVG